MRRLLLSADKVAERLSVVPGMRVLEIGPGSGYVTQRVASRMAPGDLLACVEVQLEMLRTLRRRTSPGAATLVCGSGSDLPFRNAVFDRVLLVAVLGEIADHERAIRECARVLRPQGVLAVTESLYDPDYVRPGTLATLAERAGFAHGERFGTWVQYTQCLVRR